MTTRRQFAAALAALALAVSPVSAGSASSVPVGSTIERIAFEGPISVFDQTLVLGRIGVKAGDVVTKDLGDQLGSRLRTMQGPGLGFSYRPGNLAGRTVLVIASGC